METNKTNQTTTTTEQTTTPEANQVDTKNSFAYFYDEVFALEKKIKFIEEQYDKKITSKEIYVKNIRETQTDADILIDGLYKYMLENKNDHFKRVDAFIFLKEAIEYRLALIGLENKVTKS